LQEVQNQINVQKNQLLHQSIAQNHQTDLNQNLYHQTIETNLNYQTEENVQNIENVQKTDETHSAIQEQQIYYQQQLQQTKITQLGDEILQLQQTQEKHNHETVLNLQMLQNHQKQMNIQRNQLIQQMNRQNQQFDQTVISHHGGNQTLNYFVDANMPIQNGSEADIQQVSNTVLTSPIYNPQNIHTVQNMQRVFHYQTLQNRMEQHNHQYLMHQTPQEYSLSPVSIVYGEEATSQNASNTELVNLKRQVDEVVRDLKTVEEKTIVRKQEVTAQQKEIVREIIKTNSNVLLEGSGQDLIRREVKKSMEEGMPENIQKITNKVYRKLEKELKMERGRRGMN
jgi:hypothetical protein